MTHEMVMAEARSFMKSRVVLTAAELDFFTYLDGNPSSSDDLACTLGLDRRAATRLLDCLVAFGVLAEMENH
jgi:hypothetical protein